MGCSPPGAREQETVLDPVPEFVLVEHPRELRAVWIATVANIDFPSEPGLDAEAQQAELTGLLDLLAALNFNAVLFQVRPEGDALYRSDLEPWSRFLTGTQGGDPGYDPLAFLIENAHARNIEVHAWFNPYRAKSARRAGAVAPHVSVEAPGLTRPYGTLLWMDPGEPAVRERTVEVVLDVVRRYDIDGVHFDDYFYPYPNETDFPDAATYAAYVAKGGTLDRADWRRHNVDTLVREVAERVRAAKPWMRFGISPFGIYRSGEPEGIRGLNQVDSIYADPLRWAQEGWVDYLAPQLYWPTTQEAQAHEVLLDWWAETVGDRAEVFVGNYLSQIGNSPAWTIEEYETECALARAHPGVAGNIWFSGRPLLEDREGVQRMFAEMYATPALPPPVPRRRGKTVAPPRVEINGDGLCISHREPETLRSYALYGWEDGRWRLLEVIPTGDDEHLDVGPGRYAVTAVGRDAVESLGSVVDLGEL